MSIPGSDANLNPLKSPITDPYYDSTIQPSTNTSVTVSSSTQTLIDSLSSSSADAATQSSNLVLVGPSGSPLLPTPSTHVNYGDFLQLIQSVTDTLKQTNYQNQAQDYLMDKDMYLENALAAQYLIQLYATLVAFSSQIQSLVGQENDAVASLNAARAQLNNTIQSGRAEDVAQINAMNAATTAYLNGGSLQDYNTAVATYNNYITTRNVELSAAQTTYNSAVDTYNAQVSQNNAQLAQLNVEAAKLGITLTLSNQSTVGYAYPTLPGVVTNPPSYVDTPTDGLPMLPSITNTDNQSSILTTYYQPVVAALLPLIQNSVAQMNLNNAYLDLQYYYLAGRAPNLPNAYIQQAVQSATGNSSTAVSAGSSLATLGSLAQSNSSIGRVLSDGLYKLTTLQDSQPLSPRLYDELVLNTVQLLGQVSAYASLPATSSLAQQAGLIPPESPAVGLSVGYGVLKGVVGSISGESYKTALGGLISANASEAGLSEQGIAQAQRVLTATTNLAILQIALVQAAVALQSPGLVSQFLSNLENLPNNSVLLASSSNGSQTNDVLQNAVSRSLLSSALAAEAAKQGLEVNAQAINNALANAQNQLNANVNNPNTLQNALSQEFQQAGLSSAQANALAALTVAELGGSANLPFLNGVFSGVIDSANLPISTLAANIGVGNVSSGIIEQAIQSSLAKASSPDSFQLALNTALTQAGLTSDTAASVSRNLTVALAQSAFTQALGSNLVNLNLLQASVAQSLQNQNASTTTDNAATQANAAVTAAVGHGPRAGSVADLKNILAQELINQGIAEEQAKAIAQSAIVDYANPEANPLESGSLTRTLQPQELAQQVFSRVFGLASDLGPSSAQKLASNYTLALLGLSTQGELTDREQAQPAASVLSLFKQQLQELSSAGQLEIFKQWVSQMRDLTNPNLELAQFLSQIKEPATVLLSTAIPSTGMQQLKRPIDSLQV
ncbi:hypothetical protein [Parachlamydia acanthamoebae]|uniref:hypothetical protein n=1 Tax=Parachlamydia acanthamoebae TaxID=83552 RepID=UPI0024E1E66A|nr:hypothetical protein [Parachlamydia acanthamoebae]